MKCQICSNESDNRVHRAKDLNISGEEEFDYLECANCGSLQLMHVPDDMARYYPTNYYAYGDSAPPQAGVLRGWAKKQKYLYALRGRNPLGFLMSLRAESPPFFQWLSHSHIGLDDSILDVGCGTGHLLNLLSYHGFRHLRGADPFIERDLFYPNGVTIWKRDMAEVEGSFDFIMLHHSFEHMSEPLSVLRQIKRLLKPGAQALIRVPVASSYAWRHYGVLWAQLDPPRHLFLHTPRSMELLAEQAGLELKDSFFDSYEFGLMISEENLRNAQSPQRPRETPSPETLLKFRQQAQELNEKQEGDQMGFYFYNPTGAETSVK